MEPAGQPEGLGEGEAVAEGEGEPVGSAPSRLAISCCAAAVAAWAAAISV
jgi:hypothetical protein